MYVCLSLKSLIFYHSSDAEINARESSINAVQCIFICNFVERPQHIPLFTVLFPLFIPFACIIHPLFCSYAAPSSGETCALVAITILYSYVSVALREYTEREVSSANRYTKLFAVCCCIFCLPHRNCRIFLPFLYTHEQNAIPKQLNYLTIISDVFVYTVEFSWDKSSSEVTIYTGNTVRNCHLTAEYLAATHRVHRIISWYMNGAASCALTINKINFTF